MYVDVMIGKYKCFEVKKCFFLDFSIPYTLQEKTNNKTRKFAYSIKKIMLILSIYKVLFLFLFLYRKYT